MNRRQYRKYRSDLESALQRTEDQRARFLRQIEALDIVWNDVLNASAAEIVMQSAQSSEEEIPDDVLETAKLPGQGTRNAELALSMNGSASLTTIVRGAALQHEGLFTTKDLVASVKGLIVDLNEEAARTTVSKTLAEMADKGEIERVQKGAGRKPSIFTLRREVVNGSG